MLTVMANKKKRPRGRPRQNLAPMSFNVPVAVREGITEAARRSRRSITTECVIALENHLRTLGLLPSTYTDDTSPDAST